VVCVCGVCVWCVCVVCVWCVYVCVVCVCVCVVCGCVWCVYIYIYIYIYIYTLTHTYYYTYSLQFREVGRKKEILDSSECHEPNKFYPRVVGWSDMVLTFFCLSVIEVF